MFFRRINDDTGLSLSVPRYADELFALTDRNREFLRQWLPWLDRVQEPSDLREFIEGRLLLFQRGEALELTIFHRDTIAGAVGYSKIDQANDVGHIGYWLGEEYNGRGIMTESVRDLVKLGFEYYGLNRIEIRCEPENQRSRAVPERLGFKLEGTIRQGAKLYDRYADHAVYGLLMGEAEWT